MPDPSAMLDHVAPSVKTDRNSLFIETECADCALRGVCGGAATTPCYRPASGGDNQTIYRGEDAFEDVVENGRRLSEVRLEQSPVAFPILIPSKTRDLAKGARLNARWAAVTIKSLLAEGRKQPGEVNSFLARGGDLRSRLGVGDHTQLLAVLNGQDYQLEGLWTMERAHLYDALSSHGFAGITAPTFSVTAEHIQESPTTAAHNVGMLLRHHRVLSEINELPHVLAVPNIYWRDKVERKRWTDWLRENQSVHTVSRDFSRTKTWDAFRPELKGLVQILRAVDRRLHVIVVGVGAAKAEFTLRCLADANCTASFVTSDPIHTGMKGAAMCLTKNQVGKYKAEDIERYDLALHNLQIVEHHLISVAEDLPIYGAYNLHNLVESHSAAGSEPDGAPGPVRPERTRRKSKAHSKIEK